MKLAVLDSIRALPEIQEQIKGLVSNEVAFPDSAPASHDELVARTGDADAVLVSTATELSRAYFDTCP